MKNYTGNIDTEESCHVCKLQSALLNRARKTKADGPFFFLSEKAFPFTLFVQ